jgi:hypothetical protein
MTRAGLWSAHPNICLAPAWKSGAMVLRLRAAAYVAAFAPLNRGDPRPTPIASRRQIPCLVPTLIARVAPSPTHAPEPAGQNVTNQCSGTTYWKIVLAEPVVDARLRGAARTSTLQRRSMT